MVRAGAQAGAHDVVVWRVDAVVVIHSSEEGECVSFNATSAELTLELIRPRNVYQ